MVEAQKLSLPYLSLSSPQVTSLFYDPVSQSLALMHSDSTFSLFPSFSLSSLPPIRTLIPAPSSSASFLTLNPNPKISNCPDFPRVVFVTAGPHEGGSRVCLRFWVLGKDGKFRKSQVVCSQNGVCFDRKLGVIVDVSHGVRVMLAGSVNYLAMYSSSSGKMWVFGVKLVGEESLRLVKCAVIDCQLPVLSICVSSRFLVLGELHGVRVFPLRALVKGRVASSNRRRVRVERGRIESLNREKYAVSVSLEGRKSKMLNGVISSIGESYEVDKKFADVNQSKSLDNGRGSDVDGVSSNSVVDGNRDPVKPRSLKLRQDSGEVGMQFIVFDNSISEGVRSKMPGYKTKRAISIQVFSQKKFLILDSDGEVYLLHISKSSCFLMRRLTGIIQVQQLAAFPDTQNVWVTDGLNSLHKLVISDATENENENENEKNNIEEKIIHSSVTNVIFASEKIQYMIPLAANSIMILGQDSLYTYAIS